MKQNLVLEERLQKELNHFKHLIGEGYLTSLYEDGEDDNNTQQANAGEQEQPQDGGMPDTGAEMPPMGGAEMPSPDGGAEGLPTPPPPIEGGAEMPPMDDMGSMPPMGDTPMDEPESDNIVIDVDDITQAQEKLNKKENSIGQDLGQVDGKIEKVLQAISAIQTQIQKNNEEIAKFKADMEKRNPTDSEKLNLRSLQGAPYNVNLGDYWNEKMKDGNYNVTANNDVAPQKELQITQQDVDDYDPTEIAKTFSPTLKDIFKGI